MPQLIEGGHVFIAKPPLYKVRAGGKDIYIEKEAELEELLLRDKLEKLDVRDREHAQFKLTQARWQRFNIKLKQYEGWSSSLRAEYGHDTVAFLEESQILDSGATSTDAVIKVLKTNDPEGEPYETELVDQDPTELVVRVIERATGSASTHRLRREMLDSSEYKSFVGVHSDLNEMAGTPPFSVSLGKTSREARSFEALRRAVLEVAGEGVKADRFKGLGEMNPDQLFDTTMDPEKRMLQRVTIDDASAADQVFSMLMGDKVEPRRLFIEAHAHEVTNLDV
jgi:DNA gyrase subunit B